jgi:hypothetical protein
MTRVVAAVCFLLAALSLAATGPRAALACSADESFVAIDASDVIVAGRITGWTRVPTPTPTLAPGEKSSSAPFTIISVQMDVEHLYKGATPALVTFLDAASLNETHGDQQWVGSSGGCGVFNSDPTGQYAVMGLTQADDGSYHDNLLLTFFVGTESDPRRETALGRLMSRGLTALPAGGGPPSAAPSSDVVPIAGAAIAAAGLMIVLAALCASTPESAPGSAP